MSSSIGENIRLTVFGESHGPAIGMTLEGIPAGLELDMEALQAFLDRRAPGRSEVSTSRREADKPEFLSGVRDGTVTGSPIAAIIRNTDARSGDYASLKTLPRPGHADYTAQVKYFGHQDAAGGGHFSGRLTAPLCIAGAICLQLLAGEGIRVISRIAAVGSVEDEGELWESTAEKAFPTVSEERGRAMQAAILEARAAGDSLGGVVECAVLGLPAGLGDPIFGGMENRIAALTFGIPAVKGVEFGAGFAAARMRGSEHNDPFVLADGQVAAATNHAGGILGGITTGMPLRFRAAVKPTPSIAMAQRTLNMRTMQPADLRITGRHDPCIVPRAVPCVEAAAALAVTDALLGRRKERN